MYTQLSNPQVTSPEAKKIQQDICLASQRGQDPLGLLLSPTVSVSTVSFCGLGLVFIVLYSLLSPTVFCLYCLLLAVCDAMILCVCISVHASLKSVHEVLTLERERLRNAWNAPDLKHNTSHQLAALCSTLSEVH